MDNQLIGNVTAVSGDEITIQLTPELAAQQYVVDDAEEMPVGQIGSYVSIHQSGVSVLASVMSNWQQQVNEQTEFFILRSLLPVLHSHAGKLYDSPGILLVLVIEPVMAAASFTFMLSFLFTLI